MDYDYSKRGYLLPKGCKDLIDVSKLEDKVIATEVSVTENSFLVTAQLPKLENGDIEITVEGRQLRIVGMPEGEASFEAMVEVPDGYQVEDARAIYFDGELRIVVPKEAEGAAD
jgi:HSP20 family molecular chaperone IbpA